MTELRVLRISEDWLYQLMGLLCILDPGNRGYGVVHGLADFVLIEHNGVDPIAWTPDSGG